MYKIVILHKPYTTKIMMLRMMISIFIIILFIDLCLATFHETYQNINQATRNEGIEKYFIDLARAGIANHQIVLNSYNCVRQYGHIFHF